MLVSDLLEELKRQDPNLEVLVDYDNKESYYTLDDCHVTEDGKFLNLKSSNEL